MTRFHSTYQRSWFFDKRFYLPFLISVNRTKMKSRERILPILIPTTLTDGIYSLVSNYDQSSNSDQSSSDQLNYQPTTQPTTTSTSKPTTQPGPTIWDQRTVNKPPTCREVCTAKGQRCGLAQLMPVPLYKCEGFWGSDLQSYELLDTDYMFFFIL